MTVLVPFTVHGTNDVLISPEHFCYQHSSNNSPPTYYVYTFAGLAVSSQDSILDTAPDVGIGAEYDVLYWRGPCSWTSPHGGGEAGPIGWNSADTVVNLRNTLVIAEDPNDVTKTILYQMDGHALVATSRERIFLQDKFLKLTCTSPIQLEGFQISAGSVVYVHPRNVEYVTNYSNVCVKDNSGHILTISVADVLSAGAL